MSTAMRHSRYMLLGIAFGYLLGILWWSDLRQITLFSQPAYSTPYHSLKSNRNCICDHCNANIGSSSMPENSGNKSLATLRLPPGISVPQTDLYRRRLWGNPSEDLPWKPRYLVTFTVGVEQKESINRAAKKFSRNFTVMLFHYDGKASEWDELEWSRQAIHVSAPRQTKWWFAKRFLHPDAVAPYDYIFIWDEDLGLENFDAEEYLRVVERHGLEISQPAVDTGSRGMGWTPVFSRKAWKCVWKMIQNDLVHGWGLDFKFHNCVGGTGSGDKAAHEIMGVVDSQWVVHRHLSSLGLVKSVYKRCLLEARLFSDRWDEADFEHVCCEEVCDSQM